MKRFIILSLTLLSTIFSATRIAYLRPGPMMKIPFTSVGPSPYLFTAGFGSELHKNPEYLYLRGKIFYLNKLYYLAIDTLLIALEFEQNNKNYNLIAEIYDVLGNKELSKKLLDLNSRLMAANSLKDELSGIYRKNH